MRYYGSGGGNGKGTILQSFIRLKPFELPGNRYGSAEPSRTSASWVARVPGRRRTSAGKRNDTASRPTITPPIRPCGGEPVRRGIICCTS